MAKLELVVKDSTKELYYHEFYEAKIRDRNLTHDKFIRALMGLR